MTRYRPAIETIAPLIRNHGPLEIAEVARATQIDIAEIRKQIQAYSHEDVSPTLRLYNPTSVYIEPARDDGEPCDEDLVCIEGDPDRDILGVEVFDASVYGPLYDAADDLLNREPDNEDLASAVVGLREHFLPGIHPRRWHGSGLVAQLDAARKERHKVRISYSRAWEPGRYERVVEPLALVRTGRGYELDAGPVHDDGSIRTYLISRIGAVELLDESFEIPLNITSVLAANRKTTEVRGFGPHRRMWAVRKWAEQVETGKSDEDVEFLAHLLPPMPQRAALMQIDAGSELELLDDSLREAAADLARDLLRHHGLDA